MPSKLVKSFAKKTGKSVDDVEKYWDKAQDLVEKNEGLKKSDPQYYPRVVGYLKNMLGMKESVLLLDKFTKLLKET